MNELLVLNVLQFLWGLILGFSLPLTVLYVMRSIKKAGLSGWRYFLGLVKRILIAVFILFWTLGLITLGMEQIMPVLVEMEGPAGTFNLTTGYILGSNIGLIGGIVITVIGVRKGRQAQKNINSAPG